ncbi:response regulator receiver sensor signal transduction histidine kinase [Calothrix sp. NIES-4071]|nr:response regulator receiver sensor signal transduction histidine kinase [Calothrix sp. NIES-4071]BAZ64168.1 response regulator receiver sensor signal transduction histidine kinase [Calothrix sp. NIES-4105]
MSDYIEHINRNHNKVDAGIIGATILIADDTPYNLGVLFDYLGECGFEVLLAEDGESLLEQVKFALPDIILLDVMMPGINGFETCRILKANEATRDIPVIFMTSLTDTVDKLTAFSVGAIDYVTKPLEHEEVLARVTTHLKLRNLQKKLEEQNERLQQEIEERLRIEKEVKQLNEDLKSRTVELETVNQELEAFSYSVSHDLSNPLSIINGYAYMLQESEVVKQDVDAQHSVARIQSAAKRMEQLIEDLMHLSKVTRSEMRFEPVDLSEIASDIVVFLEQRAPERNIDFIIADNVVAQGDARLLRIVLENLLGNAWKYSGKKSHAQIEFGKTTDLKLPTYFVRDNGVGFDQTSANKLFRPFVRLHSRKHFEGTGIGLATVQRIIQRHGGHVWVEAQIDVGATFYFTLQ